MYLPALKPAIIRVGEATILLPLRLIAPVTVAANVSVMSWYTIVPDEVVTGTRLTVIEFPAPTIEAYWNSAAGIAVVTSGIIGSCSSVSAVWALALEQTPMIKRAVAAMSGCRILKYLATKRIIPVSCYVDKEALLPLRNSLREKPVSAITSSKSYMARIVLNIFGSFGDLHPFLAIAIELQRRGHRPLVAGPAVYREKVEAEGVAFAGVRPDLGKLRNSPELIAKLWDTRRGTEFLIKDLLAPQIEGAFEDLREASRDADLLLTHTAGFAGPIVAEALHLRWLSVALQPAVFFSAYDQPVLAPAEWLKYLRPLGRWPFLLARRFGRFQTRRWFQPLFELRRRLGLPANSHPLFEGQFSPHGTLALFSSHYVSPQPDWPPNVTVTGFVFYDTLGAGFDDQSRSDGPQTALSQFLRAGPPPIVFTLGSSAVMHPGSFFRESVAAARKLDRRAVLLMGNQSRDQLPEDLPDSILPTDYVPYSQLLPQAALTVHQGGIGTTAQALAAGHPMLVVPWSHDQPDNAAVLRRLGVSLTVSRKRYRHRVVARALKRLTGEPKFSAAAQQLGKLIRSEDGITAACDAIERALKLSA